MRVIFVNDPRRVVLPAEKPALQDFRQVPVLPGAPALLQSVPRGVPAPQEPLVLVQLLTGHLTSQLPGHFSKNFSVFGPTTCWIHPLRAARRDCISAVRRIVLRVPGLSNKAVNPNRPIIKFKLENLHADATPASVSAGECLFSGGIFQRFCASEAPRRNWITLN